MAVFRDLLQLPDFTNAVLTIGTFDGVHQGHQAILKQVVQAAQAAGGESILVTFDPHPRTVVQPDTPLALLTPLDDKIVLVSEAGIDHVVVVPFTEAFASLSADEYVDDFLAKRFRPHTVVIGYDHRFGRDRSGDIALLRRRGAELGFEVAEIPAHTVQEAAVSSTKIRRALEGGQVGEAAAMLGRPYSLRGTVVEGKKLGRTIGYPTANLRPLAPEQLLPADGVYAATVITPDGHTHHAMLNIGFRPTVDDGPPVRSIEAHVFDYSSDLYGATLTVQFRTRLRAEQKFASLDALKAQLAADATQAQAALSTR